MCVDPLAFCSYVLRFLAGPAGLLIDDDNPEGRQAVPSAVVRNAVEAWADTETQPGVPYGLGEVAIGEGLPVRCSSDEHLPDLTGPNSHFGIRGHGARGHGAPDDRPNG